MKSSKGIKDKLLIIFKTILGEKGITLWIMAIVGGFFAAQLRHNGRLTLINRDSARVINTADGDTEYSQPLDENLCGDIFRDYAKAKYEYQIKEGIITKEDIEKEQVQFDKDMKRIRSGDIAYFLEKLDKENALGEIFVESCETRLSKTASNGWWWTVGKWSFLSWIGLKIASEIKD